MSVAQRYEKHFLSPQENDKDNKIDCLAPKAPKSIPNNYTAQESNIDSDRIGPQWNNAYE